MATTSDERRANSRIFWLQVAGVIGGLIGFGLLALWDWQVGQWRWNPNRTSSFRGDLAGTLLFAQVFIGGACAVLATLSCACWDSNRIGTPKQRWYWLAQKVICLVAGFVILGSPWYTMTW